MPLNHGRWRYGFRVSNLNDFQEVSERLESTSENSYSTDRRIKAWVDKATCPMGDNVERIKCDGLDQRSQEVHICNAESRRELPLRSTFSAAIMMLSNHGRWR